MQISSKLHGYIEEQSLGMPKRMKMHLQTQTQEYVMHLIVFLGMGASVNRPLAVLVSTARLPYGEPMVNCKSLYIRTTIPG